MDLDGPSGLIRSEQYGIPLMAWSPCNSDGPRRPAGELQNATNLYIVATGDCHFRCPGAQVSSPTEEQDGKFRRISGSSAFTAFAVSFVFWINLHYIFGLFLDVISPSARRLSIFWMDRAWTKSPSRCPSHLCRRETAGPLCSFWTSGRGLGSLTIQTDSSRNIH